MKNNRIINLSYLYESTPGFFSYLFFGSLSLLTIILIKKFLGDEITAIYIFLNTTMSIIFGFLSFGFMDYIQIYNSKNDHKLKLIPPKYPIGLSILLFYLILVNFYFSYDKSYSFLNSYFIFSIILAFIIIFLSESIFKIKLLVNNNFQTYMEQNLYVYLSLLLLFAYYLTSNYLLILLQIFVLFFLYKNFKNLYKVKFFSFFSIPIDQLMFFLNFITITLVDNFLIFSTFDNIKNEDYVILGIIIKTITPFFVLLNIYYLRRKVNIISSNHLISKNKFDISFFISYILLFCLYISSFLIDNNLFFYVALFIFIKLFVYYLIYEFQSKLPRNPITLILITLIIWLISFLSMKLNIFDLNIILLFTPLINFISIKFCRNTLSA
jgi:hypothetical protein